MEGLQQLLTLIDDLAHLIQVKVPTLEQLPFLLLPYVQRALQEPGHRRCQQMAVQSPLRTETSSNLASTAHYMSIDTGWACTRPQQEATSRWGS